jgi:hypothetical protein
MVHVSFHHQMPLLLLTPAAKHGPMESVKNVQAIGFLIQTVFVLQFQIFVKLIRD